MSFLISRFWIVLHTSSAVGPSSVRTCLFLRLRLRRIMSLSSAASSLSSFPTTRAMNLLKLTKILLDHDRCIQWCKEHNLLASSFPCPNSTCCNTLRWTRRSSSRDGYEWRCSKKNCNGMASIRQNSWFSGSKLSIEKNISPNIRLSKKFYHFTSSARNLPGRGTNVHRNGSRLVSLLPWGLCRKNNATS